MTVFIQGVAAAGGAGAKLVFTSDFSDTTRYSTAVSGSGSAATQAGRGQRLTTGATATSGIRATSFIAASLLVIFDKNPEVWFIAYAASEGTDYSFYCGLGNVAGGTDTHTFTVKQMGLKALRATSVTTTSFTNGNGTTETATSFTNAGWAGSQVLYRAIKDGTTNIKFYEDEVLKVTHTTNLPAGALAAQYSWYGLHNSGVASDSIADMVVYGWSIDKT